MPTYADANYSNLERDYERVTAPSPNLAEVLGQTAVDLALTSIVDLDPGNPLTYSPSTERQIDDKAAAKVKSLEEQYHIDDLYRQATNAADPSQSAQLTERAHSATGLSLRPDDEHRIASLRTSIKRLEGKKTTEGLDTWEQQQLAKDRLNLEKEEHAAKPGFRRRRRERNLARNKRAEALKPKTSPHRIAREADPTQLSPRQQRKHRRNLKKEQKREALNPRNVVTTKGTVLEMPDSSGNQRKYVVIDTHPVHAQAYRDNGGGNVTFDPIYYKDEGGALKPVPRGDLQRGNQASWNPNPGVDPNYYFRDGTVVKASNKVTLTNPDGTTQEVLAISDDSFKPSEDIVELQPLLSGAEAVQVLMGDNSTVDLAVLKKLRSKLFIRISDLTHALNEGEIAVPESKQRKKHLEQNLIFVESPSTPGAPGKVTRYTHKDGSPETKRRRVWLDHYAIAARNRQIQHARTAAEKRAKNK